MREIPLIDISGSADRTSEIEQASRNIGFMYVAGHGIAAETIASARAAVIDYFALSFELKSGDRITPDNYRGYIPLGFFTVNSGGGSADHYEGYKLHHEVAADDPIRRACRLYGPNEWPAEPLHFRKHILAYWRECDRVMTRLLGAYAEILGTSRDGFLRLFDTPLTNMTLLHYPPRNDESDGFGIHPHKDTDALTIVANDPVGGLLVRACSGQEWIAAEPPGDALIVNIGDMLELWSGGYFVSTPHKVVNASGAERYSFPYFAVPRYDTIVEPIRTPQPGFDRPSIHVGDASREVWRTNWPDAVPDASIYDGGTLEN